MLPLNILVDFVQAYTDETGGQSIFPVSETYKLYPFLQAKILHDGILLRVPLITKFKFRRFSFTPFPTCVDGHSLMLNTLATELLMESNNFKYVETTSTSLKLCKHHFNITLCEWSHIEAVFQSESCLANLVLNIDPSLCLFTNFPKSFQAIYIHSHTVIFNGLHNQYHISCLNGQSHVVDDCNILLPPSCTLKSDNINIPAKSIHSNNTVQDLINSPYVINHNSYGQHTEPSNDILSDHTDDMLTLVAFILSAISAIVAIAKYLLHIGCYPHVAFRQMTRVSQPQTSQALQEARLQMLHLV